MSVDITLVNHVVLRNNAADETHSVSSPELETCQTGLECLVTRQTGAPTDQSQLSVQSREWSVSQSEHRSPGLTLPHSQTCSRKIVISTTRS